MMILMAIVLLVLMGIIGVTLGFGILILNEVVSDLQDIRAMLEER